MKVYKPVNGKPIHAWIDGVPVDGKALDQLFETAALPFIHHHMAVMPDVHWGMGATVGSVIPTRGAIVPAAVGVDIGCGMMAVRTNLVAADLPDSLAHMRYNIEKAVPHGRSNHGGKGDVGSNKGRITDTTQARWDTELAEGFDKLCSKDQRFQGSNSLNHLGTLGTGNHFIEVCLDEEDRVWIMLHSGSRGIGNRIGMTYIKRAQKEAGHYLELLPNKDLAFISERQPLFKEYIDAVGWAQDFARINREIMMKKTLVAVTAAMGRFVYPVDDAVINCHHNYVAREHHFGANVWITRKGAVRAREGDMGIIPGSMGARSFITRGLGNEDALHTSSHGAGRIMSRGEARRTLTVEDHVAATEGVECKKDESVLDESPAAYKNIDTVMAAQKDIVEIVHTLRQVICVKG